MKQESMARSKEKIYNPTETALERDLVADLLNKDFNTTIKDAQRTKVKEGMEKVKKTMPEQNGNINKETENLCRI